VIVEASGYGSAAEAVAQAARGAWPIRELLGAGEWAERYLVIAEAESPERTRFRLDRTPEFREPLADWTDPEVERIVLKWGVQLGKSLILALTVAFTVDADPAPGLLVSDSKTSVDDFVEGKLLPTLDATPVLAARRLADDRAEQQRRLVFSTTVLYTGNAGSAGRLAGKTVGRLWLDELDKYPETVRGRGKTEAGAVSLARARLAKARSSGGSKELNASTPTEEGLGIDREYAHSDRARWEIPCPSCGAYQALEWSLDGAGGVKWEGGTGSDLDELAREVLKARARRSAFYECRHCGGRIESFQKRELWRRGRWVREGQEVRPDGEVVGDAPAVSTRGYRLSWLDSSLRSFGDAAAEFIDAGGTLTRYFVNSILGDVWREESERTTEDVLASIVSINATHDSAPEYLLGTVPPEALALTGSLDIQKGHGYYLVVGWGLHERAFVVDFGTVDIPFIPTTKAWAAMTPEEVDEHRARLAARWAQAEELVRSTWPAADGGEPYGAALWSVDTGYNAGDVYRFAERMGSTVRAVKGDAFVDGTKLSEVPEPERFGLAGPMPLALVGTNTWKTELHDRLHRLAPAMGSIYFPTDFFDREGRRFLAHMASEVRKRTASNRRGWAWEKKRESIRNDWLDLFVYSLSLAMAEGLSKLTPDRAVGRSPSPDATARVRFAREDR
jgi:phage terminase large subunit GpA-like protein